MLFVVHMQIMEQHQTIIGYDQLHRLGNPKKLHGIDQKSCLQQLNRGVVMHKPKIRRHDRTAKLGWKQLRSVLFAFITLTNST